MDKKVILFDFDGVIADTIPLSFSINKAAMPDLELAEWKSWFEGNVYNTMRKVTEEDNTRYFIRYREGVVNIAPIEGIVELIKELADNYTLAIISSSTQVAINEYLEKYGLKQYFVEVLGVEAHKSKVEKFNTIMEKYNFKPEDAVFVTDTMGDIKESKKVGIRSVGVVWGVHSAEQLTGCGADFVVDSIDGLFSLLK